MSEVRIGLIGTGFMSKAHATVYQNVPAIFGTQNGIPVLETLADIDASTIESNTRAFGFPHWTTDWRKLVNDPNLETETRLL